MQKKRNKRILFVCLGNICRSAAAEAICKQKVAKQPRKFVYEIDSAGTFGYHQGEKADPRMVMHGHKRGYEVDSISRKISYEDIEKADLVIAMDYTNREDLLDMAMTTKDADKIVMMTDFANPNSEYDHVPDPYYGGAEGFDYVIDILEECIENMINLLETE